MPRVIRLGQRKMLWARTLLACSVLWATGYGNVGAEDMENIWQSHPPMRPLPTPSDRPMHEGPAYFVDAAAGDDANAGTRDAPWQSVQHAVSQLEAGDTLYLRGGVYYERVIADALEGEPEAPITIRSHPGELAILDGGFREFAENPASAWEPVADGQDNEFRSTQTYPELAEDTGVSHWHDGHPIHPRMRLGPSPRQTGEQAYAKWGWAVDPGDGRGAYRGVFGSGYFSAAVKVTGNFADSMIPLHGYWNPDDMPADDPQVERRLPIDFSVGGPGVWFDMQTRRVHIRLSHTAFEGLGERNYRGETDPREIPLVIGGSRIVFHLDNASHVRFEDIVFRGTRNHTLNIERSENITLDGVTIYGGAPGLYIKATEGFTMTDSALRGLAAPWSSRASQKYYGIASYVFIADSPAVRGAPQNRDFEMRHSEITDCHDGPIIGTIDGLRFHHNRVDNFNDDGLYLTTDIPPGRDIHIHQNYISRCLGAFAFAGNGRGQKGRIAYIHRNLIDLREPINRSPGQMGTQGSDAGLTLTHGSPIYMPMHLYHNTILVPDSVWRGHYGAGIIRSAHRGDTSRRVFNNIFFHIAGMPGTNFRHGGPGTEPPRDGRYAFDGNLHWSAAEGDDVDDPDAFFADFHASDVFQQSQAHYPPGWTTNDVFADPEFVGFPSNLHDTLDVRLASGSPAIDAGVAIPSDWPDALREQDAGEPDIGALPYSIEPWSVGIDGRIAVLGPEGEGRYPAGVAPRPLSEVLRPGE